MEIKELLQTLPAVSGSDFTIWKTESENLIWVTSFILMNR